MLASDTVADELITAVTVYVMMLPADMFTASLSLPLTAAVVSEAVPFSADV